MKTKLIVAGVAILVGVITLLSPGNGPLAVIATSGLYLAFGVWRSSSKRFNPFNDVPNAFRVLLAGLAAVLALSGPPLFGISGAAATFLAALLLNDEYQRRAFDSLRKRRVGGTVALLGIDGSGKSTHSTALAGWFKGRGYYCTSVPFHRYLFVEKLPRGGIGRRRGSRMGGNPLRPFLSAVDNLVLSLITSFGRGLEGRVVLYDRYSWSTYVKYEALGYPVRPLRWLYMLPHPRFAVILDIPVEKSLSVIGARAEHVRYKSQVLAEERREYLRIAKETGFPVVDATREYTVVQKEIEERLSGLFPTVGAGH